MKLNIGIRIDNSIIIFQERSNGNQNLDEDMKMRTME